MIPLPNFFPRFLPLAAPHQSRPRLRQRSPLILILLIGAWSILLGMGLASAEQPSQVRAIAQSESEMPRTTDPDPTGATDLVPQRYQLGENLYLENCSACHIAVPPQVFPTQTWQQLLEDPQHYGVQLTPLVDPGRLLVWNYLRTFSRPLNPDESVPYRLGESRYFKALHPRVQLPATVRMDSCISCHPGVFRYNFRSLTPQWQNSP